MRGRQGDEVTNSRWARQQDQDGNGDCQRSFVCSVRVRKPDSQILGWPFLITDLFC